MNTVLIIEDNANMRESICKILEAKGYGVFVAISGKIGLALAKEKKPDIILCDVLVPEMDGYNIFDSLKDDPDSINIPFIFITESTDKNEVEKCLAVGADGCIAKPLDGKNLCDMIERSLKKKEKSGSQM